jgi:hypothetical protein
MRNPNIDVRNFVYTLSAFDHYYPVIKPKINQIVQARDRLEDPMPLINAGAQAALQRISDAVSTRGTVVSRQPRSEHLVKSTRNDGAAISAYKSPPTQQSECCPNDILEGGST